MSEINDLLNKENTGQMVEQIICEEKGLLPTTSTTSTTFTTKLIDNWGYINLEEAILIEQLSKLEYIFNYKGEIGIANLEFKCSACGTIIKADKDKIKCSCGQVLTSEHRGLHIKDKTFILKNKSKDPLYLTPKIEDIREFLVNLQRAESTSGLFNEIVQSLETLFDFSRPEDSKICALYIIFSYVVHYFNSSFYLGIDSTKGAGKTTLLEILTIISRHGFLADVSPAAIPRLKTKYDLLIGIDEVDQLHEPEDIAGMLRKGQRRGNKYVRLNKNSLEEEIYEAFGLYCYSFRSQVEDAFKQRSVLIRTARCKDSRLSVINIEKLDLLRPLFNKIFFWYIQNIFTFGSESSKGRTSRGGSTLDRDVIYSDLTQDFTKEEKLLIATLLGRNSEIGYLFIKVCKFLGIDLTKDIEKTMTEKQEEEETPDDYYKDLIKSLFEMEIKNNSAWLLKKGEYAGYRFYPKTKFYMRLISELKNHNLMGIGTPKYNSLLKDVGFMPSYNIKNQKYENMPTLSLIFTTDVLKKLNVEYEPPIIQEEIKI